MSPPSPFGVRKIPMSLNAISNLNNGDFFCKNFIFSKDILREKSLAIYFGDSQFRRNKIFNFMISKIYVDRRLQVQ